MVIAGCHTTLGVPSAPACLCPVPAEAACPGTSLAPIHAAKKVADAFLLNECPALLNIHTRDTAPVWSLVAQKGSDRHGTLVTRCQLLSQLGKFPTSGEELGPYGPGRYCSCGQIPVVTTQSTLFCNTYCFEISIFIFFSSLF